MFIFSILFNEYILISHILGIQYIYDNNYMIIRAKKIDIII